MKEEHQDKLAELLIGYTEKAGETTGTIVEWLQIQAPELCSEIITYNTLLSASGIVLGVMFLITLIPVGKWCCKFDAEGEEGCAVLTGIGWGMFLISGLVLVSKNAPLFLKCYFAPKLFLLEYMKGFM